MESCHPLTGLLVGQACNEFGQRLQLLLVDEVKFLDEEDEMLEGCVEVGLLAEADDLGEVRVVDVGVDAEEPLEDIPHNLREILGEGHPDLRREDLFVIELLLHPCHQKIYVFWRRALDRFLYIDSIGPHVLISEEIEVSVNPRGSI